MKTRTFLLIALVALLAMSAAGAALAVPGNAPGHANADATVRGVAQDPNNPGLGEIEYLFNPAGYQFWFTATTDVGAYDAGHSYHNVYKYDVQDSTDWCGPVTIPNRLPYNAGGTAGQTAYYKIWDITTETWVCGSDGS